MPDIYFDACAEKEEWQVDMMSLPTKSAGMASASLLVSCPLDHWFIISCADMRWPSVMRSAMIHVFLLVFPEKEWCRKSN
ncbi:MAG: hypothetical protein NC344_02645 [Bacteroidales bacterium]|nr:hypothetical protein [Bacteroidales bacterium]MCM1146729.1 hypothetical protein [Bacteroidales bacterium]MCM1205546.1 hypothetical protein [Bacillota bacterium]MCM1509192.1 hypothetical protein [Clostridium sp.]